MMKSILFWLLATAILISGPIADAQQSGKIFRIGFLDISTASGMRGPLGGVPARADASLDGSRERISPSSTDLRESKGSERLPELAAELVRLKVDLIVVSGTGPALAAKRATTTIPIVMTRAGDPVGEGLVASLARPGGNVTGLSSLATELNTKRLEILKDAVPKLARVGFLRRPGGSIAHIKDLQLKELRPAAVALKLKLEEIETQPDAKGLESAFQTAKQKQVNAIMTITTPSFFAERKRIVELAGKYRLPAIYFQKEFVDEGGLMSYGADYDDLYPQVRLFTWTRS